MTMATIFKGDNDDDNRGDDDNHEDGHEDAEDGMAVINGCAPDRTAPWSTYFFRRAVYRR